MTDKPDADKTALLLNAFNQTFEKISREGSKHGLPQDNIPTSAKRISTVAAWEDGESRGLGTINGAGLISPFAKVNGKGYVEPVGLDDQKVFEKMLERTADRVARTIPCKGEGSMYHYSFRGPTKVF